MSARPTGLPAARAKSRCAPDACPSHLGPLPLGGFRLTIDGTWRSDSPSQPPKMLMLDCFGKWRFKLKRSFSAEIEGSVQVEGIVETAPMTGVLSVMLPKLGFDLVLEFTDSREERYGIKVSSSSVFNVAARHTLVKGELSRGVMHLGEVVLRLDGSLLKKALPSLN